MYSVPQLALLLLVPGFCSISRRCLVRCEASSAFENHDIGDLASSDLGYPQLCRLLFTSDEECQEQNGQRSPIRLEKEEIPQNWDEYTGTDELSPTTAEIEGFVQDAVWSDISWDAKALQKNDKRDQGENDYPDQEEVRQVLPLLTHVLFRKFLPQHVVPSEKGWFKFGHSLSFNFTFVWLNLEDLPYPDLHELMHKGWATSPEEYPVCWRSTPSMGKKLYEFPSPVHYGREVKYYKLNQLLDYKNYLYRWQTSIYKDTIPYDPEVFPTLSDYIQMRMNGKYIKGSSSGQRWPGGMLGAFRSHDRKFGFAWRVSRANKRFLIDEVHRKMGHQNMKDDIYKGLVETMYGLKAKERGSQN